MMNAIKRLLILSGLALCTTAAKPWEQSQNGKKVRVGALKRVDPKKAEAWSIHSDRKYEATKKLLPEDIELRRNLKIIHGVLAHKKQVMKHTTQRVENEELRKKISRGKTKRDKFQLEHKLGEGAFGSVGKYKVSSPNGTAQVHYAIKTIKEGKKWSKEKTGAKLQKSVSDSPYINGIVDTFGGTIRDYEIVMELGMKRDFSKLMKPGTIIGDIIENKDEEGIKFYVACLLRAIERMHSEDIIHRDLKPSNLIINPKNGYLQVADFGLATKYKGEPETKRCGTARYFSPELARATSYGKEVDWWAFGVILYQMFANCSFPFSEERGKLSDSESFVDLAHNTKHADLCRDIRNGEYPALDRRNITSEGRDLIRQLLEKRTDQRLKNDCENYFGENKIHWKHNIDGIRAIRDDIVILEKNENRAKVQAETVSGGRIIQLTITFDNYKDFVKEEIVNKKLTVDEKAEVLEDHEPLKKGTTVTVYEIDSETETVTVFVKGTVDGVVYIKGVPTRKLKPLERRRSYLTKSIKGWEALKRYGYTVTKNYLQVRKITKANKGFLKLYWSDKGTGAEIEFVVPEDHPYLNLLVRNHAWFQGFDWELLDSGKYPAPWLPVSVGCRAELGGTSKYPGLKDVTLIIDRISQKVKSKDGKKDIIVENLMADCHIENNPKEKHQIDVANLTTIYTPWNQMQKSKNKYLKNARTGKWEMQTPLRA